MNRILLILATILLAGCNSSVTIVHFTDYHSHATPFYVRGERDAAGIARAFGYIEPLSRRDDVVVFNGGDTMNLGAPPWSDRHRCVEWPWWNGVVDAMAYGNHDADYGPEVFRDCQASIEYPILGANVRDERGNLLFLPDGKPYLVLERSGRRIGLFAVTGSDFPALLKSQTSPTPGVTFSDRVEEARRIVRALRDDERADAVVLFGHAHNEEDEALARAVPGIDLILGTHSHKASPLERIDGTDTWMIASGQYLEHVSKVSIDFRGRRVVAIRGELVPMTEAVPPDPGIAAKVAALQDELESDPAYSALFRPFGTLGNDLSNEGVNERTTDLGGFVMEAVRQASGADVAISTSSSFRGGLAAGAVTEADLMEVLPYDNTVVVYEMTSRELAVILSRAADLSGTDSSLQLSGVSIDSFPDVETTWKVATTDYLATVSPQWRDLFAGRAGIETGLRVRGVVRAAIE